MKYIIWSIKHKIDFHFHNTSELMIKISFHSDFWVQLAFWVAVAQFCSLLGFGVWVSFRSPRSGTVCICWRLFQRHSFTRCCRHSRPRPGIARNIFRITNIPREYKKKSHTNLQTNFHKNNLKLIDFNKLILAQKRQHTVTDVLIWSCYKLIFCIVCSLSLHSVRGLNWIELSSAELCSGLSRWVELSWGWGCDKMKGIFINTNYN